MTKPAKMTFADLKLPEKGIVTLLVGDELDLGEIGRALDEKTRGQLTKAAQLQQFSGKKKTAMSLPLPQQAGLDEVLLIGVGKASENSAEDWLNIGGYMTKRLIHIKAKKATVVCDLESLKSGLAGSEEAKAVAAVAAGALLQNYRFLKYKTKNKRDPRLRKFIVACREPDQVRTAFKARRAQIEGVYLARDLVNEPANKLGPKEFSQVAAKLSDLGVEVQILRQKALRKQRMGALLAVGQGSARKPRVVVMRWNGADDKFQAPLAFIGKGVVFDTGGISLKPGAGMGDMKGDMGGAACVTGLMHTLAARKAKVNAVGVIGLVENMPSSKAYRPGDVVKSMSGQTIEVLNTDAEGRLVLADVLWYAKQHFAPELMINLATLTGAILVALGKEYAGLFSNNDALAKKLIAAGQTTGEKVWRMPLAPKYDKMIDSQVADMKNIGGRYAGSITAAQFLQRFVGDVPWAHLDVAGTAMDAEKTDINPSWGSGFGVRLLDELVREHYDN